MGSVQTTRWAGSDPRNLEKEFWLRNHGKKIIFKRHLFEAEFRNNDDDDRLYVSQSDASTRAPAGPRALGAPLTGGPCAEAGR